LKQLITFLLTSTILLNLAGFSFFDWLKEKFQGNPPSEKEEPSKSEKAKDNKPTLKRKKRRRPKKKLIGKRKAESVPPQDSEPTIQKSEPQQKPESTKPNLGSQIGLRDKPKSKPNLEPELELKVKLEPESTAPGVPIEIPTFGLGDEARDKKIRVLVVDDNKQTAKNVSRLLYFEDDIEVVGNAHTGIEGVESAIKKKPHIVLMDINMPDMDGIQATKEMAKRNPFSQVIIMSVQADPQYMKGAMLAGARDFQPKPFSADELVSCIRRVYELSKPTYEMIEAPEIKPLVAIDEERALKNGPVIAIYSPKGGCGSTSIASNLAIALKQTLEDVIVMDGNLEFGDVLVHLNTRATRSITDLIRDDAFEIELIPQVLLPHNTGLKLMLGPPRPELAELITPDMVTEVIRELKTYGDAVIVDTKTFLSNDTLAILEIADYILVVTVPELTSIKNTKLFLDLASLLDFSMQKFGLIVNRADLEGGIPARQIKKVLKMDKSYDIPNDPQLNNFINKGILFYQQNPESPISKAIATMREGLWETLIQLGIVYVSEEE